MDENYDWFALVSGDALRQGDLLFRCPVLVPKDETADLDGATDFKAFVDYYDVIVMSQSCDLENKKVKLVSVCTHWPFSHFTEQSPHFKTERGRRDLIQGNVPGYHLINRSNLNNLMDEPRVVDFRNVYGLPFEFLSRFSKQQGERLRLLPPYREHLSQSFARFFMRVGLPVQVELEK